MKIVSQYTDAEALADGFLFSVCSADRISNMSGLTEDMMKADPDGFHKSIEKIFSHREVARETYEKNIGGGIFTLNVKTIKGEEKVWLIPNEKGGLTLMRPEDY